MNQPSPNSQPQPQQPLQGIPYRGTPPHGQQQPPNSPNGARGLAEYFRSGQRPGDAGGYLVLPMPLIQAMPPPWQQAMIQLLEQYGQNYGATMPERYHVQATESRPVSACDEAQLAAVGITADFDEQGDELVYTDPDGQTITNPDQRRIYVAVADPATQPSNATTQQHR
ncbi:hypothetical protein SAMN04487819_1342 [Actinopolyspora alba]|uniref:Uncharacterized protein n=1 Tax=Actinopolyspora alba TaxID=673379 RepID=A0A1I2CQ59_9ACTN|nr:hypothetical protein [Actinopolyspora alba]SFE70378.1 hypothetical protein SAMN04487819_1342 [Actinopolyspora alba]